MNKCCLGLNIAKDATRNGNGHGNARQPSFHKNKYYSHSKQCAKIQWLNVYIGNI